MNSRYLRASVERVHLPLFCHSLPSGDVLMVKQKPFLGGRGRFQRGKVG